MLVDSVENIERFIELNLRNGIDHLVIFLDDPANALPSCAHDPRLVTLVPMDAPWWGGHRPDSNSRRQRIAANVTRVALARLGWADWLIFIDGDEIALLDRETVDSIPSDQVGFRLAPLEAVSDPAGPTDTFKRLLPRRSLRRLKDSGLIDRARNNGYFHGHITGKVAIRPTLDLRLHVHKATDVTGVKTPLFEHEHLRHLHFESQTFQEFVRKWQAHVMVGSVPSLAGDRADIAEAFVALRTLPEAEQQARQRVLYERYVQEDRGALLDRGVLVHVDLEETTHLARGLGPAQVRGLEQELQVMSRVTKRLFLPGVATQRLQAAINPASQGQLA